MYVACQVFSVTVGIYGIKESTASEYPPTTGNSDMRASFRLLERISLVEKKNFIGRVMVRAS